ncbi:MAG: hypothetical protein ACYTFK_06220 [Planctomycetota bacterium]
MNQVVEDGRNPNLSFRKDKICAVLEHHHAGRLRLIILGRDIDPIIMRSAGINVAIIQGVFRHRAFGDTFLR